MASNLAADTAAQQAAVTKVVAETKPEPPADVPDMPAFVKACVAFGRAEATERAQTSKAKKAEAKATPELKAAGGGVPPSADTLVLSSLKTDDERRKCTKAVLDYYRQVQEANRRKADAAKKAAAPKAKVS